VVLAGSGDNPQTKVLAGGDLLSLGTSFVDMVATSGQTDPRGSFNAMYDGLGRPFMFGCRTNGALVWDRVRALHGKAKKDYTASEIALSSTPVGSTIVLWQPETESFPLSPSGDLWRAQAQDYAADEAGIVDSSLALVYLGSKEYSASSTEPMSLTGGPSGSPAIVARVAAIFDRPVRVLAAAGAAAGAACAGIFALKGAGPEFDAAVSQCADSGKVVEPDKAAARALRAPGGYFERLQDAFKKYPPK
jgi:xylulokinase